MKRHLHFYPVACCFFLVMFVQQLAAQAPVISSFNPAEGPVGSLITVKGDNLNAPTNIKVGGTDAVLVSGSKTQLVVMVMTGSLTGNISVTTAKGVAENGTFTVTATKAPNKRTTRLVGQGIKGSGAGFGGALALSADGTTAVIGAPYDSSRGAGFIFIRNNAGEWVQQAKLVASSKLLATRMGLSVAINADGNTAILGAPSANKNSGAAWVFVRNSNGVWAQQHKLAGINRIGEAQMGSGVAVSADGNTAAVGGFRDNDTGTVWVFTRNKAGEWIQQGNKLLGTDSNGVAIRGMGYKVAISADGNTLAASSFFNDVIWVFARNGQGEWAQQGNGFTASGIVKDTNGTGALGYSLAISADGKTIIAGAPYNNNDEGGTWVFTRNSQGVWEQQGNKLLGSGSRVGNASLFPLGGIDVGTNADGTIGIIGGPFALSKTESGYAWLFTRSNSEWTETDRFTPPAGVFQFGIAAAISADGRYAMVTAHDDADHTDAVYVFSDSAAALPVNIANFKAYLLDKGIQTAWAGYNEINMSGYDVERSGNGYQFSVIGHVIARGQVENSYTLFDGAPLTGDNFYRIKALDKDGTVQYSPVVKINTGNVKGSIRLYPNPVADRTIHIQLNNAQAGNYAIVLYSSAGQKIRQQNYTHTGGSASVTISAKGLAAGVYSVEVKGKTSYSARVVLQ